MMKFSFAAHGMKHISNMATLRYESLLNKQIGLIAEMLGAALLQKMGNICQIYLEESNTGVLCQEFSFNVHLQPWHHSGDIHLE